MIPDDVKWRPALRGGKEVADKGACRFAVGRAEKENFVLRRNAAPP
jgi:hypothetical protein